MTGPFDHPFFTSSLNPPRPSASQFMTVLQRLIDSEGYAIGMHPETKRGVLSIDLAEARQYINPAINEDICLKWRDDAALSMAVYAIFRAHGIEHLKALEFDNIDNETVDFVFDASPR